MTQYLGLTSDNRVDHIAGWIDPPDMAGPLAPPPADTDEYTYVRWDQPVRLAANTSTEVHKWVNGAPIWIETAPLEVVAARAIDQIDSAADAARIAVIAKQTNTPEYQRAEAQARAFKAAGYPVDDVPRNVAGWVAAKWRDEMTAQEAADDIIATADRWYQLLDDIRDMRLAAKEDVRHATDSAEVAALARRLEAGLYTLMVGAE